MAVRTKTQLVTKNAAVIRRNGPASQSKTNGLDHYDLNLDIIDTLFDEAARLQLPEYNPSTSYRLGEGILVDGVIYRSIAATTGPFNTAHWQPLPTPGNGNNTAGDALKETITQANHGFVFGEVLRNNGTAWVRSLAVQTSDTDYSAEVAGMVTSLPSLNSFVLTTIGLADVTALNLQPQRAYFLSATVPGAITQVAPTQPGQVVKPVLLTRTAGTAFVLQMTGEVLGPGGTGPGTAKTFDPAFFTDTASVVSLANSAVTAGTYGSSSQIPVIQVDAKGRITGVSLVAVAGGGTGGVDSFDRFPNRAAFPATGDNEKIYLAQDTNRLYVWNGSNNYVETAASAVFSVNGKTGAVSLNTDDIAEAATNRWFTAAREAALNASIAAKFTLPSGSAGQFLNHLGQFSAPPVGGSYTDAQARAAAIDNATLFLDRAWSSQTTKAYVDGRPTGITSINGLTGSTVSLDASEILLEGFTLSTTAIAAGIDLQIAFGRLQGQVNARFTLPTGGIAAEYINGLGQRAAFNEVTVSGDASMDAAGVLTITPGSVGGLEMSQSGAVTGQVWMWNGTAWSPGTVQAGAAAQAIPSGQVAYGTGTGITSSAQLQYTGGKLKTGASTQPTPRFLYSQVRTLDANTDQASLGLNLSFTSAFTRDSAAHTGSMFVFNSGVSGGAAILFYHMTTAGTLVNTGGSELDAANLPFWQLYGDVRVNKAGTADRVADLSETRIFHSNSTKTTRTTATFQNFSANASIDQSSLSANAYWNGSAVVRDNTAMSAVRIAMNSGTQDLFTVFALAFIRTNGTQVQPLAVTMDNAGDTIATFSCPVVMDSSVNGVATRIYNQSFSSAIAGTGDQGAIGVNTYLDAGGFQRKSASHTGIIFGGNSATANEKTRAFISIHNLLNTQVQAYYIDLNAAGNAVTHKYVGSIMRFDTPIHADNAAAAAAGLEPGTQYRTPTGELRERI